MRKPSISPLQAMVNGINAATQAVRAQTQMTLGALIDVLAALPQERTIVGLCDPHSYRGYYEDLAFEPTDDARTVAELLAEARGCMGEVFQGYKGGDFMMGRNTPVWVAHYGGCGQRLMGLDTEVNPIKPLTTADEE